MTSLHEEDLAKQIAVFESASEEKATKIRDLEEKCRLHEEEGKRRKDQLLAMDGDKLELQASIDMLQQEVLVRITETEKLQASLDELSSKLHPHPASSPAMRNSTKSSEEEEEDVNDDSSTDDDDEGFEKEDNSEFESDMTPHPLDLPIRTHPIDFSGTHPFDLYQYLPPPSCSVILTTPCSIITPLTPPRISSYHPLILRHIGAASRPSQDRPGAQGHGQRGPRHLQPVPRATGGTLTPSLFFHLTFILQFAIPFLSYPILL